MHPIRPIANIDAMPASYRSTGHFWIQEYVTGRLLRFGMEPSGMISFGDRKKPFEGGSIPPHYRAGVRAVRENIDRDVLRERTADVEAYTFIGVIPLEGGIHYDWERIPAFLGFDIWDGTKDTFAPEDVTERVFEAIGLESLPAVVKEVPARSFNPDAYEIPESRWATGQAAGVLLRKKNGEPALLPRPDLDPGVLPDAGEGESAPEGGVNAGSTSFETWLEAELTLDSLADLHGETEGSVWERSIEELTRLTAMELARRTFDEFGPLIEGAPDRFESLVGERISGLYEEAI